MPARFLWQSRVQRTFRREPLKAFSFADNGIFDFEEEEDGLDAAGLDLYKRKDNHSNTRVPHGGGKIELAVDSSSADATDITLGGEERKIVSGAAMLVASTPSPASSSKD